MCGFVGAFRREGPALPPIDAVLRLLEHRGPDGVGYYDDERGRLSLGFRRLAIIDLETGQQPIANEDGTVIVVLNGEIYNYVELTAELKRLGHSFRSHGDSEVLVHLYEEFETRLFDHLQGMFAFALWDTRKGCLIVGRDHAGIKPVYYTTTDRGILFASEVKPLLRFNPRREVDAEGLVQYLTYGYTVAPTTIFQNVRKIPPGHYLIADASGERIERFWDIDSPQPIDASAEALPEIVLEAFDDAVRLNLRSDVPVGAFLSGGLDSSLIVARASRLHPKLQTYTLRFEGAEQDESALAEMVAKRYRTEHRLFTVKAENMVDLLPRIVWACDEPLADSGLLPNYVISELAAADGVKVVLNGAGGDELFAGYTYFFPNRADEMVLNHRHLASAIATLARPVSPDFARKVRRALAFESDTARHYVGRVTVWPAEEIRRLVAKEFAVDSDNGIRLAYYQRFQGDSLNAKLYADLKTYLPDDLMLLLDRMTMIHSLEGRVPFLHRSFIECVMRIPGPLKAPNGQRKGLLRRVAEQHLPEALLQQPKMGFNAPVREWITGPLGDRITKILLQERTLSRPWWIPERLTEFVKSTGARRQHQHRLFLLFMLELFARVHEDNHFESARDVPPLESL